MTLITVSVSLFCTNTQPYEYYVYHTAHVHKHIYEPLQHTTIFRTFIVHLRVYVRASESVCVFVFVFVCVCVWVCVSACLFTKTLGTDVLTISDQHIYYYSQYQYKIHLYITKKKKGGDGDGGKGGDGWGTGRGKENVDRSEDGGDKGQSIIWFNRPHTKVSNEQIIKHIISTQARMHIFY